MPQRELADSADDAQSVEAEVVAGPGLSSDGFLLGKSCLWQNFLRQNYRKKTVEV